MKTSKRFLSIVLMLAMLVSMFTVMAFADEVPAEGEPTTQVQCQNPGEAGDNLKHEPNDNWGGGKEYTAPNCAEDGNYWYMQCGYCKRWCWHETGDGKDIWHTVLEEPTEAARIPKTPHTLQEQTDSTREYYKCSACGKFFSDYAGKNEIQKIELTFSITTNGVTGAKVLRNGTEFAAGTVTVWSDETNTFVCEAGANVDYTVCWKLDGGTVSTDKSYTLPTRLQTGTHTLSVEFAKPTSEKKTLTVEANKSRRGDVKYGLRVGSSIDFNLEKNEVVTVTAVAKSGYEFSYWTSEDIKIADRDKYDSELTITMIDKNAKVTAVFVEKSSPSHTHKWVDKFNDTYHWKECSRCGDKTDKEKHTYIYAYDNYGYRYEKCKYCDWTSDYSYNHSSSHKDYTYEDINATYHWKTCKKCDYSVKEYHTWIKNTDRKTRDSYPYVCKYCDRLSKTDYTDLPFYDVDGNVWYYDDVLYAYINGYMDGLSAGQFAPNQNTTRAQIVTILWRLTGEPRATKRNPFTDVSSSQYYYDAISWAYDAGVVDGFDAHTFKPDQNVTREQLAAILYRYAEYMNLSTSGSAYLSKYRDADKIANWAYDAMAWANYRGLINGTSATRIDPKGYATRAQIAAILHRFAVEYGA